jgi:hypothetical protein
MVSAKKRRFVGYAGVLALGSGLCLLACNSILGIGPATDDPALDMAEAGLNCATYCSVIMANCTGDNAEYLSTDVCLDMCGMWDQGMTGDMGDSLACRLALATKAASNPADNCPLGGPLAVGCPQTTPCYAFCELDFDRCNPVGLYPYTDDAGDYSLCETDCAAYPYVQESMPPADAGDGGIGDIFFTVGNTLNCRLYHLENAYVRSDAGATQATHCPHTAQDSPVCD